MGHHQGMVRVAVVLGILLFFAGIAFLLGGRWIVINYGDGPLLSCGALFGLMGIICWLLLPLMLLPI